LRRRSIHPAARPNAESRLAVAPGSGTIVTEATGAPAGTAAGVFASKSPFELTLDAKDWPGATPGAGAVETVSTSSSAVEWANEKS